MSIEVIEVLNERKYKAGYVIRTELWEHGDDEPTEMKAAYTPSGDYIGDTKDAYRLCKLKGIRPEKLTPGSNVCSIGFCESEQKWYGWSHRATYGFGVGDSVKRGDCAYHPTDKDDFLLDMVRFWSGDNHTQVGGKHVIEDGNAGVRIGWWYDNETPNEKIRGKFSSAFHLYPDNWGVGEWTSKTLEDAKQMACDFAEGVS